MPRMRDIAINANGGAYTDIFATISCTRIEFVEDEATPPQGLQFKAFTDGFTNVQTVSPGSEPVQLPNMHWKSERGPLIGLPAQGQVGAFNYVPATKLLSVVSAAGATTLRVIEYE